MSETCVCPCIIRAGGLHGRKGSYRSRLARPGEGLYLRPVLFFRVWYRRKPTIPKPRVSCYGPTLTKTDTMLHCISSTSGRCGRVCRHPPLTKHRNKNSINVKLTKTGTGCLRCTSTCSGVRRQGKQRALLRVIATARANIRPIAEPEPERFADYNFVRGAPFCCRSGFLTHNGTADCDGAVETDRCGYPT